MPGIKEVLESLKTRIKAKLSFFIHRRIFLFYFTVALLFLRIPTGVIVVSMKKENVAVQMFECELL